MSPSTGGRGWAYGGAALGGLVSILANVAHSYVPPAGAGAGWVPQPGAVIGAVFWPVALVVALEVMARTAWPCERRWVAVRWLGLLPVALVAAVVSYRHLSGLLTFYGEDGLTATVGPLAVDGLMVMATGALLATAGKRTGRADRTEAVPPAVQDRTPRTAPVPVPAPSSDPSPSSSRSESEAGPGQVHKGRSGPVPAGSVADLLLVGRAVAADLAGEGRPLTRAALIAGLRGRGHRIATGRASELLHALKEAA